MLPAVFDYINPGSPASAVLGLLTHIAAIKDLAGALRSVCKAAFAVPDIQ